MPYPLIVLSRPPYEGSAARSSLDLALAYAVFDQKPRVLFLGKGLLQLKPGQVPPGRAALSKVIDSFPLYDIEEYYVAEEDIEAQGLQGETFPEAVRALDAEALCELRRNAACVLSL